MTHKITTHGLRALTRGFLRAHLPYHAGPWQWAAPVFGLLWIVIPAVDFASSRPSAWQVAFVAAALAGFASAFLAVTAMERPPWRPLVALTAISVALTLAAEDVFALLFMYAASAAGVRLSGRTAALAVAGISAIAAATLAFTDPDGVLFWSITATVLATGTLWFLIGGLFRANAELREARSELAELAVAEERLRFARDLHDLLGHDLSLIALKAELAGKLLHDGPDRAAGEIDEIRMLTRSALSQVREAVDGYRRPTLASELAGARVALEGAGIELTVDGPPATPDPEIEAMLAWAVREGTTNVLRHSGARHAEITVGPTGLEIVDDGRGNGHAPAGHGLTGLRERAQAVGGTVEAGPGPGGGFRLRVSVPAA